MLVALHHVIDFMTSRLGSRAALKAASIPPEPPAVTPGPKQIVFRAILDVRYRILVCQIQISKTFITITSHIHREAD